MPKTSEEKLRFSTAVSAAIGNSWLQWQSSLSVPGLPWYPAFAARRGRSPPMPNIPVPLAALTQVATPLSK